MSHPSHAPSEFCSAAEAAAYLGFSPTTLEKWRAASTGPRFYRHGRRIRYTYADLTLWLNAYPVETADATPA